MKPSEKQIEEARQDLQAEKKARILLKTGMNVTMMVLSNKIISSNNKKFKDFQTFRLVNVVKFSEVLKSFNLFFMISLSSLVIRSKTATPSF